MRGRISMLGLAVLAAGACAPPAEQPATDMAAETAAIEAVRAQEIAAALAGDASSAYMTDDAVVMPPGEAQVVGKPAIQAWARAFFGAAQVQEARYDQADITVAGDWAIEHYSGSITFVPAGSEDAITETMKGIHVYRKGTDGSWKMHMDVWNMDAAAPAM